MSKDLSKLKEQYEALGREIKALETFKPGWFVYYKAPFDAGVCYCSNKDSYTIAWLAFGPLERFTAEIASRFIDKPKTRYDWPEIIKKYPEAQWASTDADGRIDAWDKKPKDGYGDEYGIWVGCGCKSNGDGGYKNVEHTKDWADSLEKRPDWI